MAQTIKLAVCLGVNAKSKNNFDLKQHITDGDVLFALKTYWEIVMKNIPYHTLFVAMSAVWLSQYANAQTPLKVPTPANQVAADDEPTTDLGTLKVTFKPAIFHRKKNEITGLGKVIKTTDNIDKEIILNIRDLTRYDPGISVVEQGRGASTGYAMRGVDKNRVAMRVDGLSQAQSYLTIGSDANGGAINEIEYEHIRAIELSKGASSSQYGSGALGGAVGLATKTSDDIIKDGKSYGIQSKTAYASKNSQFMQSVAGASRFGAFDVMAIYTHRHGKETKVHSHAYDIPYTYSPLVGYFDEYDLRNGNRSRAYYLVKDDCPTLNCTPKAFAEFNSDKLPIAPNLPAHTQTQASQVRYPQKSISAKDYTGTDRIIPNPMDYKSDSVLLKFGYKLDDKQSLGAVVEHSKQQYDSRDMKLASYYNSQMVGIGNVGLGNRGITNSNNPLDGLAFSLGNAGIAGAKYAKTRYFDEIHKKGRFGVNYRYDNADKNGVFDSVLLSFDHQKLNLNTRINEGRCSELGNEYNCRASLDNLWSYYKTEKNHYQETQNLWQATLQKSLKLGQQTHRLSTNVGIGDVKSVMRHGDMYSEYVKGYGYNSIGGNGQYDDPYVYERLGTPELIKNDLCRTDAFNIQDCKDRIIKDRQMFVGVQDHIRVNDKLDLGLGVRYDKHAFKSTDPYIKAKTYNNWSWNVGTNYHPTDYLTLSYRASSGFRVPAFYELYGVRNILANNNPLSEAELKNRATQRPEKSLNQELGAGIKGQWGFLEASVFENRYKGLLANAESRATKIRDFYNNQDVKLHGINVLGRLDWYGLSDKLPDGLYSNLSYNQVKVKDRILHEGYRATTDPILDAVQPARIIAGIGYDDPQGRYGLNLTGTYSKAKNNDELFGSRHWSPTIAVDIGGKRSRSWYAYDLIGYYHFGDKYTLRGGIYNLTNRKYSTWESVRQSAVNAVNADNGTNDGRFAAAGRNFTLSFEAKF